MAKNRNARKPKKALEPPPPPERPYSLMPRWVCPYLVHGCTYETHEDHPGPLELLSDESTSWYRVLAILEARRCEKGALDAFYQRPDFKVIAPKVAESFFGGRSAFSSGFVNGRVSSGIALFELLVESGGLPRKSLKVLSNVSGVSPEGVLAFMENPLVYDQLVVNLMFANRSNPSWPELKELFRTGPEEVRAALALMGLSSVRWDALSLFKASRVLLNRLNRDRPAALATIESMAQGWEGSLEDFMVVVDQLT